MSQPAIAPIKPATVRDAHIADVEQIHDLLDAHVRSGVILPRPEAEILTDLHRFSVLEIDREIIACGSLEIFTEELCEIRSLVVAAEHAGLGFGKMIVEDLVNTAGNFGFKRVMALTYVPEFFHRMGFRTVPKEIFPEKVWGVCFKCSKFSDCNEIAVLKTLS